MTIQRKVSEHIYDDHTLTNYEAPQGFPHLSWRQKAGALEARLDYIVRLSLKENKNKKAGIVSRAYNPSNHQKFETSLGFCLKRRKNRDNCVGTLAIPALKRRRKQKDEGFRASLLGYILGWRPTWATVRPWIQPKPSPSPAPHPKKIHLVF